MIRQAQIKDMDALENLLSQVLEVHHQARPDLFKTGARKYTEQELTDILNDPSRPIFVYENEEGTILGYAFCVSQQHVNDNILTDIRTLYLDDLCVDENARHQRVGKQLYDYVCQYAWDNGYYNVTLNVWYDNSSALAFYDSLDLKPQKVGMEKIVRPELAPGFQEREDERRLDEKSREEIERELRKKEHENE